MNQKQRDIKVPASLVWREIRIRVVPVVMFLAVATGSVFLWNEAVTGTNMVGEVETVQSAVITPDAGYVTNLFVRRFQLVKAGDPIAEIVSTDARLASAQVQDLRSRISMSQFELGSIKDRERLAFDFQSLSMNMLRFRADLSAAKAELPTLETSLTRAELGWKEQVVPYNDYQMALRQRDSARARIVDLEQLVKEADLRLKEAGSAVGAFTNFASPNSFPEVVQRLALELKGVEEVRKAAIVLRAPIDGTVGTIMRRPGENVLAGDTIAMIASLEGERIVTFVRQGTEVSPKKNMAVTVRCRSTKHQEAVAKIEEVGFQYEVITNKALLRPGMTFEMGMPVGINVPEKLRSVLRPGEVVDLAIQR